MNYKITVVGNLAETMLPRREDHEARAGGDEVEEERILHCWQGENDENEVGSKAWWEVVLRGEGTCMLPRGHAGPHVFTPDDEVIVCFAEAEP